MLHVQADEQTKFGRIDAEKTPFFVQKLSIKTLPTVVFFEDGKAIDRLLGFQGMSNPESTDFKTRELEERIGMSGAIKMERIWYEEQAAPKKKVYTTIVAKKTEEFDDPFDD